MCGTRSRESGGGFPREADDPIISKVDANAQPIFWIALTSPVHSGLELSEAADQILKEKLQRLPGVGSVFIGAERRYAMRIWLDPLRMAAHGVTTQDVDRAVNLANAEIPGGRVEGEEREFAVRTRGELDTAQEFADIIVVPGRQQPGAAGRRGPGGGWAPRTSAPWPATTGRPRWGWGW